MKKPSLRRLALSAAIATSCAFSVTALGEESESPITFQQGANKFADALKNGDFTLSLRYRYELVETDTPAGVGDLESANASTLRTRATYKTGEAFGFSGLIEFDDITVVGQEQFNSGPFGNGFSEFSVVADDPVTEVNQAYIDYAATPIQTKFRGGRQRIKLDNDRFIGNVGWRQNEQTFDGIRLINSSLPDTTVQYANIFNVNRIFGNDADEINFDIVNIKNTSLGFLDIIAYGYYFDEPEGRTDATAGFTGAGGAAGPGLSFESLNTTGLRLTGKTDVNLYGSTPSKLLYTLEYAIQDAEDFGTAPGAAGTGDSSEASYFFAEGGISHAGHTFKVGYEVLGSDDGEFGFSTPLATLHAFNGWADQFLATPIFGLEDLYFALSGTLPNVGGIDFYGIKYIVKFHQFSSNEDNIEYGTEFDAALSKKFKGGYSILLKYADYNAEAGTPFAGVAGSVFQDEQIFWTQLSAKF